MMFKAPYKVPSRDRIRIGRGFGPTSEPMDPVGPDGEAHFHYGVDIVFGDARQTYGVPLVLPFPSAKLVAYQSPANPDTTTSFATFRWKSPEGDTYDMTLAHVSEIVFMAPYAFGDEIAFVGNAGKVWPKPDIAHPWDGAHLHLGLKKNGTWVDPKRHFDLFNAFIGPADEPQKDVPAVVWMIEKVRALLAKLLA